jgi:hypothetical protein
MRRKEEKSVVEVVVFPWKSGRRRDVLVPRNLQMLVGLVGVLKSRPTAAVGII